MTASLEDAVHTSDRVTALAVAPESIAIAGEVLHERKRVSHTLGALSLPDGTGHDRAIVYVNALQRMHANRAGLGVTWAQILLSEVSAVMNAPMGSRTLRDELLSLAAACTEWIEDIDRREVS